MNNASVAAVANPNCLYHKVEYPHAFFRGRSDCSSDALQLDALVDSLGKSSSELALSDVEAELSKASVVGVQLPQVGVIEDHVSKARQWVVQAEAVLAPPAPGAPRRDAAAVENLVTAATSSPFKLAMKPELLAVCASVPTLFVPQHITPCPHPSIYPFVYPSTIFPLVCVCVCVCV
jgi:hypothetical protein